MTTDAGRLRCPGCGAATEPGAGRCPYCRARLATISCPSCFTLGFDGAAFCHKCGAPRVRARAEDAGAACPGCRNELRRVDVGSTPLYECATCDGVWVDADVFERICAQKAAQAAVLHHLPATSPVKATGPLRYRPCLRCGKMMNRVNFGKISGTVIDVCRGHGTFLDASELHQIVAFIEKGGLDRARAQQSEEMREQERRLRTLEQKASARRGSVAGSTWNDAGETGIGVVDLIAMITDG